MTKTVRINESVKAGPVAAGSGKFKIKVIDAGWGSSGYYSQETLTKTAPTAFPVGTHVYFDHPGEQDRPERSVRDIAGSITSEAAWDTDGIYAEFTPFPTYVPLVEAMAGVVGMSIHAAANYEADDREIDGRKGPVIEELVAHPMNSVDIVTHAGRGGAIVAALEGRKLELPYLREMGLPVPSPTKTSTPPAAGPTKGHKMELTEETGNKLVTAFESVATAMANQATEAKRREDEAKAAAEAASKVDPVDFALSLAEALDKSELPADLRAEAVVDIKAGRPVTESIARFTKLAEGRKATGNGVGQVDKSGGSTDGVLSLDESLKALQKFSKESV